MALVLCVARWAFEARSVGSYVGGGAAPSPQVQTGPRLGDFVGALGEAARAHRVGDPSVKRRMPSAWALGQGEKIGDGGAPLSGTSAVVDRSAT